MRIKKNDVVIILSGKEAGRTGRVLRVDSKRDRVFVEGRNMVKKHRKASSSGQEGGIINMESGIHRSNVALYSNLLKRGVRVCARYVGKEEVLFETRAEAMASLGGEGGRVGKVRFCKKSGEVFK